MGLKSCILAVFATVVTISEAYRMCEDISPPEYSIFQMGVYNMHYTVDCLPGYDVFGQSYVRCIRGRWESPPPACLKRTTNVCPDLDTSENVEMECDEGPFFEGKTCRFRCPSGFNLTGVNLRRCMSNLEWSGKVPPKCKPEKKTTNVCPDMSAPENVEMECDEKPFYAGTSCRFRCPSGFSLSGVNLRRCMWNHQWSGTAPKCIPEINTFCPVPPPLKHGTVIGCSSSKIPRVGKTCGFRCGTGYVLQGPPTLVCQRNGKLTDFDGIEKIPECVAIERPVAPHLRTKKQQQQLERPRSSLEGGRALECRTNFFGPNCNRYCSPRDDESGHYTCDKDGRMICRSGYTGHLCLEAIERPIASNSNTGKPQQQLERPHSSLEDESALECTPNYFGPNCERYCAPRDDKFGHYTCDADGRIRCRSGYTGNFCLQVSNYCEKFTPCFGGDCYNTGPLYTCECWENYFGNNCERIKNPCKTYQCKNNGTCLNLSPGEYTCQCPPHYTGSRCETAVSSCPENFCSNGGTCVPLRHQTICVCPDGFKGDLCEERDCERGTDGCEPMCNNRRQCWCKPGYRLERSRNMCLDVNECLREALNRCQGSCVNTMGGYVCQCPFGFRQIDEYRCEGCKKNSYWLEEKEECENCPDNSYTKSDGKMSLKDCICLEGYEGSPGENIPCRDVDECTLDNFGCSHKCVNTPGSAFCSCPLGYALAFDNKTCIDIDECCIKNGGCQGICHNTEGSFRCSCPEGYATSNKDHYSCDDVDECLENNGGCAQKCNNFPGGHYCSCDDGFRLDSGLRNCTDIRCPSFPIPHFSVMKCKVNGGELPALESYPIGTTCKMTCNLGFKNTRSSNRVVCQEDGKWEGTIPECKSQECRPLDVPENGDVHPSTCSKEGNLVKRTCTFTCRARYILKGKPVFMCRNNLTWSEKEIPICQPIETQPFIKCPGDISMDLLPGENFHDIMVPAPTSNIDDLRIEPEWISTNVPISFPAGRTDIIFTASSPNSDRKAQCTTSVEILDKEPPLFRVCPEPIEIESADPDGATVTWEHPVATDNVEVVSIQSTLEPNSSLTPGTYFVEYIARDAAGNDASCSFYINVTRAHCSDLADPENGEANCMDWFIGKICRPLCDTGYARYPKDPPLYTCDGSGTWEPSDSITSCLKYVPAVLSVCPDGHELTENSETGENVCVECPNDRIWSASTNVCEEKTR